ncbi:unnamed protein product [Didymodactylos carnosus]|uniref:Retrotransposon gag domain-containing protein n=1 Tax=Didymodactylos carnosus TaxID=1234261 RepID=A0A815A3N4_9BILA|nr:unnamed protein product [Didymodactylos carnosus]CAF1484384.1 unnamed protein product [Didymodactylos carnosus]CAF4021794.1 unnamed protein product [Didymodactylos carnosus]CAF4274352.1 unnamed protein product [Didymodactylos carnosus]
MTSNLTSQILLKGVQEVEKFTGLDEQDPVTWLQAIEELFETTKTDKNDRRRFLPMYFGADVKKWYRSGEHTNDYDEFKKQFIGTFSSSTQKLKISLKLINRRQENTESIQSYYYDVLSLCTRFNPDMQDEEKMVYLLRGLKPSIQQRVIINNPKQCEDLPEQAKRVEAAAAITQLEPPVATTTTTDSIEETTAALRRMTINSDNRQNDSQAKKCL